MPCPITPAYLGVPYRVHGKEAAHQMSPKSKETYVFNPNCIVANSKMAAAAAALTLCLATGIAPAQAAGSVPEESREGLGYSAVTGLSYAELPGNAGTIDLYLPEDANGPTPIVLWSAGSGWMGDNGNGGGERVAKELTQHGYAVAAVAIRSSSQAQFPAQLHDAKAAVRWLRANAQEYGLDGDRIAAMGDSSGGWASTMLGVTSNDPALEGSVGTTGPSSAVQAVVDLFGPTDFVQMDEHMLPGACDGFNARFRLTNCHNDPRSPESLLIGAPIQERRDLAAAANPVTYVDADTPPFLIAHGTADALVPQHQSTVLFEALAEAKTDATYYSVRGYGHNTRFLDETKNHSDREVWRTKSDGTVITSSGSPMTWDTVARFLNKKLDD